MQRPALKPIEIMATILTVLKDCGPEPAPSGVIYMALNQHGVDLDTYTNVVRALVGTGLVTQSNFTLALTTKGEVKADEIALILENRNASLN